METKILDFATRNVISVTHPYHHDSYEIWLLWEEEITATAAIPVAKTDGMLSN